MKTYKILDDSYPQEILANNFDEAEEKAIVLITSVDEWEAGDEFQFVLQEVETEEEITVDYTH